MIDTSEPRARQLRDEPQSGRYPTRGYQQRQPSLERGVADQTDLTIGARARVHHALTTLRPDRSARLTTDSHINVVVPVDGTATCRRPIIRRSPGAGRPCLPCFAAAHSPSPTSAQPRAIDEEMQRLLQLDVTLHHPPQRGWRKLHLGVNRSGMIVAQALTDATTDDALTGITQRGAQSPQRRTRPHRSRSAGIPPRVRGG